GGEGEEAAEARCPAVEGARLLGEGVEAGAAGAVLDGADEEEEQAGDQAVGDVGEEGAVHSGRGHGGDAEDDEAHVADGGEGGEVGREGAEPVGGGGQQDPDEPVGAHLEQDAGQQDRADGGGGGVGVGQPAVQGPHRGLDGEPDPDRQNGDDLHGCGQRPAV